MLIIQPLVLIECVQYYLISIFSNYELFYQQEQELGVIVVSQVA